MRCRLFNIASALSLLLCLATAILWVRGYAYGYHLVRYGRDSALTLATGYGHVTITFVQPPVSSPELRSPPGHWRLRTYIPRLSQPRAPIPPWVLPFLGFTWANHCPAPAVVRFWHFGVPLWFVAILTGFLSIRALKAVVRRIWAMLAEIIRLRRLRQGLCPICGYDLRATPNCCPECGTPVPAHGVEKVTP